MLGRQKPDPNPLSFLGGSSEMAGRVRDFDWSDHPIGAPECWPQSLRSALGIALNSAFPTAIYWGDDLRLLYNDAWSYIPGPRHPGCLGMPAREVWADIWHVIEPQFRQVIETGEGLFVEDQMLPMWRFGFEEETYWTYSFTPITGADGAVEGVFNNGMEMTSKVFERRQAGLLLKMADEIRHRPGVDSAMEIVCKLLGEHLGAIRVGIRQLNPLSGVYDVRSEWQAEGIAPTGEDVPWGLVRPLVAALAKGEVLRIDRSEDLPEEIAHLMRQKYGAGAMLAIPSHRGERLDSMLYIHREKPHAWSDGEVAMTEHAFARAIQAIDHERALEREKAMVYEIEHRARNMLAVSQAIIRNVRAPDVESFRRSLLDRMQAQSTTLGLLSDRQWVGTTVQDILKAALQPYMEPSDPRVTLRGAAATYLGPDKAQPLGMAIHELATNAAKYGALSREGGALDVRWDVSGDRVLEIDWREAGGTPFPGGRAEDSSGFGTRLLALTVEGQLGGRILRDFGDEAFNCRLEFPLRPLPVGATSG